MKNINYVCVTGHRMEKLQKISRKENFSKNDFYNEIKLIINENIDKDNTIFKLWWCDWFDNIMWKILIELWYKFELYIPSFDLYWRKYWDKEEMDLFKDIKDKALKVVSVQWSYIARDKELANWSNIILSFCSDKNSWTWKTIWFFEKHNTNIVYKKYKYYLTIWLV